MEQKEIIQTNIEIAANGFASAFPTFQDKIELLKKVRKDRNFAKNSEQSVVIYKAIRLLGQNAEEIQNRRVQQRILSELVVFIQSKPDRENLVKFFEEKELLFNIFCLMVIHFNDEALSERERQAHSFMLPNFMLAVDKLTQN